MTAPFSPGPREAARPPWPSACSGTIPMSWCMTPKGSFAGRATNATNPWSASAAHANRTSSTLPAGRSSVTVAHANPSSSGCTAAGIASSMWTRPCSSPAARRCRSSITPPTFAAGSWALGCGRRPSGRWGSSRSSCRNQSTSTSSICRSGRTGPSLRGSWRSTSPRCPRAMNFSTFAKGRHTPHAGSS